ncbi:hypothetical protein SteCoe_24425 [Stentor coeruleus]|uniref:DUF676 domain-containing protein n=1 Tax=Stentor coeruleus TaxID=5963 RepID=A0A1R2BHJ4_9CILI|nr:hypothetical protein SteCoe_24425 [Stentor coeruleus]
MSNKGIIDIFINVESFRNIDLYYQGLYYIQIQAFQENNTQKNFAVPIHVNNSIEGAFTFHSILDPQINYQNSSYLTKVFMIKYSDEIVKMNETIIFQIESYLYSNPDLTIEAELFFTDLGGDLSPESLAKFMNNPSTNTIFSKVGSSTFKCVDWKFGLNQFCPIVFHDTYACVLYITIHTILLDYIFRTDSQELSSTSQISHSLFPLCGRYVQDENIERVFKDYIMNLATCCNKIRRLVKRILKNCKTLGQNGAIKHSLKPPITFDGELPISKCFTIRNKKKVTRLLLNEKREVAERVALVRNELERVLKCFSGEMSRYLEEKYHDKVRNLSMEHIYREVQIGELNIVSEANHLQSRTARAYRKSLYSAKKDTLEAYNVRIFAPEKLAILFEEINIKSGELIDPWKAKWFCNTTVSSERHLFVLVHGYMGSGYDMKTLKDVLILYKPNLLVLISESNEKHTEGSIADMGKRLANEVIAFIHSLPEHVTVSRISFIGHSLGGIIIRAALPSLLEYKRLMYAYISLASPHLGCAQFSNILVEAGLWVISKIRNSVCIQQLTLKDCLSPRHCFLYDLAKTSKLQFFEKVILVSSSQDSYVPFESARIEIGLECPDTFQLEMADFIATNIRQLHRINVDFPIKPGLISDLHGRAAHISLLDNQSFLNILVYRFADFLNAR